MTSSSEEEAGLRLFYLLRETRTWMHRQVDSLRLDAGLTNRRHVSIDFTLPREGIVRESENRIVVPIALMAKGTLSRLDISEVGKKPATVLTAKQNTFCSRLLLRAAAALLLPSSIDTYEIHKKIDDALEASTDRASEAKAAIRRLISDTIGKNHKGWGDAQIFIRLCENLAENFLFLISVDKCVIEDRAIVKFSYDQLSPTDRQGTLLTTIVQPLHDLAKVESQHIEVRVPEGLTIKKFYIPEENGLVRRKDIYDSNVDKRMPPREIAHASLLTTDRSQRSAWLLTLEPARQGLVQFARMAVIIVASVLLVGTLARVLDWPIIDWGKPVFPSPSASIFLVGPALLLSWASKQREHELLAAALEPLRKMLQLTAASLLVLAGVVALPLMPWAWETGWWIACGLSWLSLIWLVLYFANMPLPEWIRHRILP